MALRYDIDSLDNRDLEYMDRLAGVLEPITRRYFRPVIRGLERIPDGPGLYVGNHNGGLLSVDMFIFGVALYQQLGLADTPFGLAHEKVLAWPVFHSGLCRIGAVRASHENAHRIFEAGHKVLVYPGGDLESMRAFRHRNRIVFGPRRGYIRLALREDVPIIPAVAAGAHSTFVILAEGRWLARLFRMDRLMRIKMWPVTWSLPWGITVGPAPPHIPLPTRIFLEVLEPIRFDRRGIEAASDNAYVDRCHDRVVTSMQAALDRLAEERRTSAKRALLGLISL